MRNVEKGIKKTKLELDRIEGEKAVLFDEEGVEIILPVGLLPKGIAEGDDIILTVASDEAEKQKNEQKAKDILNEIFNP
jgi:hypothetical protein